MRKPIYVRSLSSDEHRQVAEGLRSSDAFVLRRSQIIWNSDQGQTPPVIAELVGLSDQMVRNVIHGFNADGLRVLQRNPHRAAQPKAFTAEAAQRLRQLVHHSPRQYGKPTSQWTLVLLAKVSYEQGLTEQLVSDETIRNTLQRLDVHWTRAKRWITSPDPAYARKKNARDRLIRLVEQNPDIALAFADETWWSRLSQPLMHSWTDTHALRLQELERPKTDTAPKALACYGLLLRHATLDERVWLRFVSGRPVSAATNQFLEWVCAQAETLKLRALCLIWDNASWHNSQAVRCWIRQHNHQVKQSGQGVRLLVCPLPIKSPWLNPIEPKWVHGKRRVAEAEQLLPATELVQRVYDAFGCSPEPPMTFSN